MLKKWITCGKNDGPRSPKRWPRPPLKATVRKRLDGMVVVDRIPEDRDTVYFGAWVRLEDETGKDHVYRIVGPDEFDPALGYISMDSPMGRALIGKSLDDAFTVRLPEGDAEYIITGVSYDVID